MSTLGTAMYEQSLAIEPEYGQLVLDAIKRTHDKLRPHS